MAANIGGTSCDYVRGDVTPLRERVETWVVPGLDSVGAMLLGQNEGQAAVVATKLNTVGACNTWIETLEAMIGSVVTIENDLGDNNAACLITGLGVPEKTAAYQPGTSKTLKVEMEVRFVILA